MAGILERLGVLAWAVQHGVEKDVTVGHTLIQKLVYFLQEGTGVDLGYHYKIYHYGPYCEDVWADLTQLEDSQAVTISANPGGFGYLITPGPNVGNSLDFMNGEVKEKVEELLEFLGHRNVRELECLATSHYVYGQIAANDEEDLDQTIIGRVRDLKPHLTPGEIRSAIALLRSKGLL